MVGGYHVISVAFYTSSFQIYVVLGPRCGHVVVADLDLTKPSVEDVS